MWAHVLWKLFLENRTLVIYSISRDLSYGLRCSKPFRTVPLLLCSPLSRSALLCDRILWRLIDSVSLYDYPLILTGSFFLPVWVLSHFLFFLFEFIHVLVVLT